MTLFVGGPYHGRDMPVNPDLVTIMRLPEVEEWDSQDDADATVKRICPHVYELDPELDPPTFRYVKPQ